jgi:hypothetical protein
MSKHTKVRAALRRAVKGRELVGLNRVSRPNQTVDGFVVAVGRKWALIAKITDGGFFDGYVAIRLREIGAIRPDTSFATRHARTQPEWPPAPPAIRCPLNLDTTREMLASLLEPDVLFGGIEQDKKRDATWIGVPNELTRHWLYIWEVSYQAVWASQPFGYRLSRITIVTIGSRYESGLAAVAGPPPVDACADWLRQRTG